MKTLLTGIIPISAVAILLGATLHFATISTFEIDKANGMDQLVALQSELNEAGIKLQFDHLKFNEQGEIQEISGKIENFGNSGTFSSDNFGKVKVTGSLVSMDISLSSRGN